MLTNIPADNVKNFADQVVNDPASLLFASLADFYRENGLCQEAINMCQVGLDAHPDNIEGRVVLTQCYKDIKDYEKARIEITKILSIQSENSQAKKILEELDKLNSTDTRSGPSSQKELISSQTSFDSIQAVVAENSSEDGTVNQTSVTEAFSSKETEAFGARSIAESAAKESEDLTVSVYSHILSEIIKTPQVYGSLLVDEVGYPIASAFSIQAGKVDEEASGALSALVYSTAAKATEKIKLGELQRVIIDTKAEKLFLSRVGSQVLIISAENSAKVGLVAVSLKKALDKIRGLGLSKRSM